MMGTKARIFTPVTAVSLDELVPANHFYRHLDHVVDLSFVRDLVKETYAERGRPSIDPVVFFKLQLVMFFDDIRSERLLMQLAADRLSVRRVALQARRTAGDAAAVVARLAEEAGVELLPPGSDVAEADLVIVLGGDGSVLRALQQVSGSGVPVFGVNFGRVGFLTTAEPDELETAVRRALAGELRTVELATVQVERAGQPALPLPSTLEQLIAVPAAGTPVASVASCGVILSGKRASTAPGTPLSLSAGLRRAAAPDASVAWRPLPGAVVEGPPSGFAMTLSGSALTTS